MPLVPRARSRIYGIQTQCERGHSWSLAYDERKSRYPVTAETNRLLPPDKSTKFAHSYSVEDELFASAPKLERLADAENSKRVTRMKRKRKYRSSPIQDLLRIFFVRERERKRDFIQNQKSFFVYLIKVISKINTTKYTYYSWIKYQ